MQMNLRFIAVVALTAFVTFTACKKDISSTNDSNSQLSAHSDDQVQVSGEMEAVANEAVIALESSGEFNNPPQNTGTLICNATTSLQATGSPRKIVITYNGVNCLGTHSRQGVVILSMADGMRWRDAGSVLTIQYQQVKITRLSDNKSITLNGTETITNVSGGLLVNLATQANITHEINSSNLSITFDNGTQRIWQVARKRVFTYNNGIVITITGNHTEGNNTNIAEWGINRFGKSFVTSITQPLTIRQDCNFRLTGGQLQHNQLDATVTFGLNRDGDVTSCPGTSNYYFKLALTGAGGRSYTFILPY